MSDDPLLPPIMQTPGLRLVAIVHDEGQTIMKFVTQRKRVREVVLILTDHDPIYGYSMYDETTNTITHYSGIFGDPTLDAVDPEGPWGV